MRLFKEMKRGASLMGTIFWLRRFVAVYLIASLVIAGAQSLKGHTLHYAALQGLVWGAMSAAIFVIARMVQSSRGEHCAICRDTPQMRKAPSDS
jgi:hypothetical protein